MGNKSFKYGTAPNYPVTSNDAAHLMPSSGLADYHGRHCKSHYVDLKKTGGGNTAKKAKWNGDWKLPYVLGKSEAMDDTHFGRGYNSDFIPNDADNSRSGTADPHDHQYFWKATVGEEGKATCMIKPMGEKYKSWATYWGDPIQVEKNGTVTIVSDYSYMNTDKFERIQPMGVSFGYVCTHETESGLVDAAGRFQMQMLLMVLRDKNGRFSLGELVTSKDKAYLTMKSNNDNNYKMSSWKAWVPGKWQKLNGSEKVIHQMSQPGGGNTRSGDIGEPDTKIPFKNERSVRGNVYTTGSRAHVYYEFSEAVKQHIVENKCVCVGLIFKWGGSLPGGLYSAADVSIHFYDMNIIAYQDKSPLDGYKFDRICNAPRPWTQAEPTYETIDGKKFIKFDME